MTKDKFSARELAAIFGNKLQESRQMNNDQTMLPQKGDPPTRGLFVAYAVVDDAQPNLAEPVILSWDGQWLCPLHDAPCQWKVHAWIGPLAVPEPIH